MATQGGNHDQHVKAGQQSHKNTDSKDMSSNKQGSSSWSDDSSSSRSGSSTSNTSGTRGGTHEQHVKAGQQSHKNSH